MAFCVFPDVRAPLSGCSDGNLGEMGGDCPFIDDLHNKYMSTIIVTDSVPAEHTAKHDPGGSVRPNSVGVLDQFNSRLRTGLH